MEFTRKFNVICTVPWSHHHSGWPYCVCGLQKLHCQNGIDLHTNSIVPLIFDGDKAITKPWTGFLHATPSEGIAESFSKPICKESMKNCLGIFTLSNYVKNFIKQFSDVPCESVKLSISDPKIMFDIESIRQKRIATIGHWMRRFESIYKIDAPDFQKSILRCTNKKHDSSIKIIDYLSPDEYEKFLSNTIVFLDLEDSSVNNTIVECIVRATPIVVNRLPATEEYLGHDYPLFYNDLKEVKSLLKEESLLSAHEYLKGLDKSDYKIENMVASVAKSQIYQSLPKPVKFL